MIVIYVIGMLALAFAAWQIKSLPHWELIHCIAITVCIAGILFCSVQIDKTLGVMYGITESEDVQ